ncbi:hypothetical protein QK911_02680 [Lactococcus lactis]
MIERLKQETSFPVKLIVNHMTEVDYPDREYMLEEKTLKFTKEVSSKTN